MRWSVDKPEVVVTVSSLETERVIEVIYTFPSDSGSFEQWFVLKPDNGDTLVAGDGKVDALGFTFSPTDDVLTINGGTITIRRTWLFRAVREVKREVKRKQTTPA